MTCSSAFIWDDDLRTYDFGPGHPFAPVRTQLAYRLIRDFGLLQRPGAELIQPVAPASYEQLASVHTPEYLEALQEASADPDRAEHTRGLGTDDVPAFAGMYEAASLVAGSTLQAATMVASGRVEHAVNLWGGLHHAQRDEASGFCLVNDLAIAIEYLLAHGMQRVAYIDVDVHHGDGVQTIFWSDPRVLTISLHETGRTLYPGTGFAHEIGGEKARGTALNIPMPPGTGDDAWQRCFEAVVPDVLQAFQPDVIVSQHGCDTHADDPLAHFTISVEGQARAYRRIHQLSHELCDGRWIATGGGGYEWVDVVPRAWTHLTAIAQGQPIDPHTAVPESYLGFVQRALGRTAPAKMGDGQVRSDMEWDGRLDPANRYDRVIREVQRAVFPALGIAGDFTV